MTNDTSNAYDSTPYPNHPHRLSHVRHLETVATLFGMTPQSIAHSRVLEIGCGGGANLVPQAYDLPNSSFIGLDYSDVQLDEGRKLIDSLGLKNIELRHANIMDADSTWGILTISSATAFIHGHYRLFKKNSYRFAIRT
jgi:tRNA G46 methylase TrmB